tara:strand:+ start:582 stop:2102 length:1521 start_codon:yes stop_codon:yes gene_type:complete
MKSNIFYPVIGIFYLGNVLIFLNFFVPLNNIYVVIFIFLLLIPNFLEFKLTSPKIDIEFLTKYILMPSILIISLYSTGWHYDAGFYHLNHQNWLRESNMILGFVNIHWAFGMSSIYEYVSAFFWLENSFILLHFLNLIFFHFLYLVLIDNLNNSSNNILRNSSLFILLFSLLDNFGINGGRNGFLYVQGVTKQDIAVGVIFFILCRSIIVQIYRNKINEDDFFIVVLLSLLIIQIKLSSISIVFLLIYYLYFIFKNTDIRFSKIILNNIFSVIFGVLWLTKQYLTTGCFIYPVNFTCRNNFDWYSKNSTESYEAITVNSSYSLPLYNYNVVEWFKTFLSFRINSTVLANFILSITLLYIFKKFILKNSKMDKTIKNISLALIVLNLIYLIYYGPTPRYLIGLMLFIVSYLGFNDVELKIKFTHIQIYSLILVSAVFLIRSTSYSELINGGGDKLFDPRYEAKYIQQSNGWVKPDFGDQCWINLECTMSTHELEIVKRQLFDVAIRD